MASPVHRQNPSFIGLVHEDDPQEAVVVAFLCHLGAAVLWDEREQDGSIDGAASEPPELHDDHRVSEDVFLDLREEASQPLVNLRRGEPMRES